MSYDVKYRKRTIEYLEEGHTWGKTAKAFGISQSTLNKWLKQYRNEGTLERKYRSYSSKVLPEELEKYIDKTPDAYQSEIAEHFQCDQSTICRAMKNLKITRKKR